MIAFPVCKINIGLDIISKRSDGYHSIETIFHPVQWTDVLEIIPNESSRQSAEFKSSGLRLFGPKEKISASGHTNYFLKNMTCHP